MAAILFVSAVSVNVKKFNSAGLPTFPILLCKKGRSRIYHPAEDRLKKPKRDASDDYEAPFVRIVSFFHTNIYFSHI